MKLFQKLLLTQTKEITKSPKVSKKAIIETGHEIPPKSRVTSMGDLIDLPGTIQNLQVGQSFVVDERKGRVAALQVGIRLCISLTSKKIESGDDGVERFRVWRKE